MTTRIGGVLLVALVSLAAWGCGNASAPSGTTAQNEAREDSAVRPAKAEVPALSSDEAETPPVATEADENAAGAAADVPAPAGTSDPGEQPAPVRLPAPAVSLDEVPDADLAMPKVSMTEAHAALCKVKVGEAFPEFELSDLDGNPLKTSELRGERMTLVVFWNGRKPTALEQLGDLARDFAPRFAARGVKIVAINSGDDPQLAAELAKKAGGDFTVLCDPEGKAVESLAAARVPSTYLVDATGRVAWFDIEYSRSTRRDLAHAIRFLLTQK